VVRVVVLGPGGAGKSTFARRLAERTGAEWIEIDKLFWQPGLAPMAIPEWEERQVEIFRGQRWIADGDLGPYDSLTPRLQRADAVVLLDLPRRTCVWRSLKRSRERLGYWRWLLTWHRRYRPRLLVAIAAHPDAQLLVVKTASDYERALHVLGSSE
jgi:adenylate kinase family enzyme